MKKYLKEFHEIKADLLFAILKTSDNELQNRLKKIFDNLNNFENLISNVVLPSQTKTNEIVALVYISHSNVDESKIADECETIIKKARAQNFAMGISGFLIYSSGYFIQYIEGGATEIDDLYSQIVFDPRHGNLRLLFHDIVKERMFPKWSVEYSINTASEDLVIRSFLNEKVFKDSKMLNQEEIIFLFNYLKNQSLLLQNAHK